MDAATAAYYNDPTRLVATKNEVISILLASPAPGPDGRRGSSLIGEADAGRGVAG